MASNQIQITERDRKIFDHIHRYRVSTLEVLHHLFWKPENPSVSLNAVSQRLKRLEGYLHSGKLVGSNRYYLLTPLLAREYGEEDTFAKPFRTQLVLARHIAMLEYCCLGDEPRDKITSREFKEGYPSYNVPRVRRDFYFHTETNPVKLGWLELDGGKNERQRAKKSLEKYAQRMQHAEFRKLADRGCFGVVLVTGSERKREQFLRRFKKMEPYSVEIKPLSDEAEPYFIEVDPFPVEVVVNTTVRDIILQDRLQRKGRAG